MIRSRSYVIAKSGLYKCFNNKEDYLHAHPAEIREFSLTSKNIASPGKLMGTLNHEYGVFREFADDEKREFIFSDVVTKGKDIIVATDEEHVTYSRGENEKPQKAFLFLAKYKSDVVTKGKDIIVATDEEHVTYSRGENEKPQKAFLFLAKYKDDAPCQTHCYNNNSELKLKDYVLGFANEKGCVKIISDTHLNKNIDLKGLFEENQDKVIPMESRTPDMYDLWDSMQCVANPIHADSTFL